MISFVPVHIAITDHFILRLECLPNRSDVLCNSPKCAHENSTLHHSPFLPLMPIARVGVNSGTGIDFFSTKGVIMGIGIYL